MTKKGRPRPSFFHYFLNIPPKSPRKIDFPSWRPKVVAVVLMVFSTAFLVADFFLELVLRELVLLERSFSFASLARRFSSSSSSRWRRFSSCFCCSRRSS